MIEVTLPFPPSVNTYWRTFRGRMIISAKGREYREVVENLFGYLPMVEPIEGAVSVDILATAQIKGAEIWTTFLKHP
jgi:Holliday junction resolvase RusA-like endonuclease